MQLKILLAFSCISFASAAVKLQEMYSWRVLDWNYLDQYSREQALRSKALIPENALPVGIERWRNKLFVSVPRWREGIPATLNYIPLDGPYDPSPKLNPYPDWMSNELGNCQTGLNTVYRIKADKCDRLWVLDVGTFGIGDNTTNVCPYSLNVYDLNTDTLIRKYVFRPEDIVPTTFIANIALDEGTTCDDTFAYFSDELGYGLLVYSWQSNKSWRFEHNFFMPDPLVGQFKTGDLEFNWGTEGIFGISASPTQYDGFKTLYFSPLASNTEFAVSTRILRDESRVDGPYTDFKVIGVRGMDSHTSSKVMDVTGVQLFNLVDQNAIGCWKTSLPLKPQNVAVVDRDDVGLVFPCDIKIDDYRNVWVISDRMPVFLEAELDYSEINFRIYTVNIDTLIKDTVCEPLVPYIQPTVAPVRKHYTPSFGSYLTDTPSFPKGGFWQHSTPLPPKGYYLPQLSNNALQWTSIRSYGNKDNQGSLSTSVTPTEIVNPFTSNKNPWWRKDGSSSTSSTYQIFEQTV